MKKSFILIIAMIFFFQLSEKSHAAFYLEPLAGIMVGGNVELGNIDGDISGNQIGARVGFKKLGLSLGLDARRSSFELDSSDFDGANYNGNQIGFFVGYDFPILLRVWGSYVFAGSATQEENDDIKLLKANGFNLGVGYSILPFISLNLELFNLDYDEAKDSSGTENIDYTSQGFLLGVSIPLSI